MPLLRCERHGLHLFLDVSLPPIDASGDADVVCLLRTTIWYRARAPHLAVALVSECAGAQRDRPSAVWKLRRRDRGEESAWPVRSIEGIALIVVITLLRDDESG